MAPTTKTILLVPDEGSAEVLRQALAIRYQTTADGIYIEVVTGSTEHVVSEARHRHGGAPIGYVATDEASALEALRHGADEAIAWPPHGEQSIQGFLDRTLLRATIRREREQLQASVVHREKLAALGTLVAGVAHEINNPLTALQLCTDACAALLAPALNVARELQALAARGSGVTTDQLERLNALARTGAPSQEGAALLEEMRFASQAIADIVRDLRIFARTDEGREKKEVVDVADLIDQVLRLVSREFQSYGYVERDYSPEVAKVLVPPGRLSQVLINTLVNAAHAIREIERPSHHVRISTRSDNEHVAISITDTGPGIAPEALDHIFDPFFTTKRVGAGTGLGLSISRSLMQDMGGDLLVTSVHGEGATFILLIPVANKAAIREAMRSSTASIAPPKHRERPSVLFVDDDQGILRAYSRAFGRTCSVLLAGDGQEAIDLLRSGSSPDAVVTELALPELDGAALYRWISRERPGLARRIIFVTADSTTERYQSFVSHAGNPLLLKPVNAADLLEAINAAVQR
jgi:signal transduction histidine kinase/CheY-like chemotaxis protein